MPDLQIHVRKLVEQMLDDAAVSGTELARRADVAPSTVNRFMNGEVKHILSVPILDSLARAAGGRLVLEYFPSSIKQLPDAQERIEQEIWASLWTRMNRVQRGGLVTLILDMLNSETNAHRSPRQM